MHLDIRGVWLLRSQDPPHPEPVQVPQGGGHTPSSSHLSTLQAHHDWRAPIAAATSYGHPVDGLLVATLPIGLGPLLTGCHVSTTWVWYLVISFHTIMDHCGYHLPLLRSNEAHEFHHRVVNTAVGTGSSILTSAGWTWQLRQLGPGDGHRARDGPEVPLLHRALQGQTTAGSHSCQ